MPALRAKIVHLSDLHFGRSRNRNLVPGLHNAIREVRPDLIVVSGDLCENPFPHSMHAASAFLTELAQLCQPAPPIFVVPGNHDYKIRGVFGLRRLTRVPFELVFPPRSVPQAQPYWRRYLRLTFNALYPWGKLLGDTLRVHVDPRRRVVLFGFNSTPLFEMLATGRVAGASISELGRWIAEHPSEREYFKIAVVHHHPIPIPYVPTEMRDRLEESFLTFYNAGAFLREVSRCGVDLVLHGHRHFAGFTRVAYDFPSGELRSMGILAAGTTTRRDPTDPLGNEFNVISVYDDDTVAIKQWYFSEEVPEKDESRTYQFYQLGDVRTRRLATGGKIDFHVETLRKHVTLTRDGYSQISIRLKGCRPRTAAGVTGLDLTQVSIPRPAYARGCMIERDSATPEFTTFSIDEAASHHRNVKARIELGSARRPSDGPFSLGYAYRLMNAHALNLAEFQRKYVGQDLAWEFATLECDVSAAFLELEVQFPEGLSPDDLDQYDAEALYLPNCGEGAAVAVSHSEETARVSSAVRRTDRSLVLEVGSPIPGFTYRLRWQYKPGEGRPQSARRKGELLFLRKKLIELAEQAAPGAPCAPTYTSLVGLLEAFRADFLTRYPVIDPSETVDVSVAVLDDKVGALRFVAATFGDIGELSKEVFHPGEGCAGFSFEKGSVLFYNRATDLIQYYISAEELEKERGTRPALVDQETLVTIPWMDTLTGTGVGVISVGSASKSSRLLAGLDMSKAELEKEKDRLLGLTRTLEPLIMRLLAAQPA